MIPTLLKRTTVPLVSSTCNGLMTRIAIFFAQEQRERRMGGQNNGVQGEERLGIGEIRDGRDKVVGCLLHLSVHNSES